MPIRTTCAHCGEVHAIADRQEGKKVRCKNCGEIMIVKSRPRSHELGDEDRREERVQERPRRRQRLAVDDDEPNRRSDPDHEDGVVERSSARRRRPRDDDEYEDDEPSPRRRRKRYQDSEDAPRRGRRGSYLGLWIGVGAGVLVVVLAIVGIVLFVGGGEFGGSWPEPRLPPGVVMTPGPSVTLHIAGVIDRATREAIEDKLGGLADAGGVSTRVMASEGSRTSVIITPVADPQVAAARIDFGSVRGVSGRLIMVMAAKADGPPDNADEVTWALHHLKSPGRRKQAAESLIKTPADQRRAEVTRALDPFLNGGDPFTRPACIEAFAVWGTADATPRLLGILSQTEKGAIGTQTRRVVLRALGRLKDPKAIQPIAECLDDFFDRKAAGEALQAFGPAAEKAVLKYLDHSDWMVRQVVCDTLKVIGTKDSLPALEALVARRDNLVSRKARDAIAAIKRRG